ncbi:hypothetical protein BCR42DRAFT_401709 [Absidia repens]|uniref:Uncharacterized protein n=1 Tax=Absidia repens TaxID=90262 RepID=A0A1X2J2X8_9FUNG|nr:hypothetical protein BCR42DRAFT_401709 [Absidia repens]
MRYMLFLWDAILAILSQPSKLFEAQVYIISPSKKRVIRYKATLALPSNVDSTNESPGKLQNRFMTT